MNTQQRACELVKELRQAGLEVARVVVDGKKIHVEFANDSKPQPIDGVNWK